MQLTKTAYYADFVIYAALIGILISIVAVGAHWTERLKWLAALMTGGAAWTLLEYLLHRFVLHRLPVFVRACRSSRIAPSLRRYADLDHPRNPLGCFLLTRMVVHLIQRRERTHRWCDDRVSVVRRIAPCHSSRPAAPFSIPHVSMRASP